MFLIGGWQDGRTVERIRRRGGRTKGQILVTRGKGQRSENRKRVKQIKRAPLGDGAKTGWKMGKKNGSPAMSKIGALLQWQLMLCCGLWFVVCFLGIHLIPCCLIHLLQYS